MIIPDTGSDKKFKQSDQNEWQIPCDHCGKYQVMDFEKNIELVDKDGIDHVGKVVREGTYRYVCQFCGKPLDRWYGGIWVPRYPTGNRSKGFRITQLDAVWISADKMKEKELKADSLQSFYNYALGKPYQDKALSIQSDDIMNHFNQDLPEPLAFKKEPYKWISAGIDWGQHFHWINILGMTGDGKVDTIALHKVPRSTGKDDIEHDLQKVIMIMNQYEPDIILPDVGYAGNYVVKLAQQFDRPNQRVVYGVMSRTARSNGDPIAHFSETNGQVTIDKLTQVMKMMYNIKAGRVGYYRKMDENMNILIEHWDNVVIRDEVDDANPDNTYKSITRKGDDHFAISSVYAMVGMEKIMAMASGNSSAGMVTSLNTTEVNQIDSGFSMEKMFDLVTKTQLQTDDY